MKYKIKYLLYFCALSYALLYIFNREKEKEIISNSPPNIILIFADDMGYGDIQSYNSASQIPTPNLNNLAKDGMRFDDAHSNSSVCSPSRYGILTGRYAWRTHLKSSVLSEPDNNKPLIRPDRLTLADMLKNFNYQTAAIGKWHLGIEWKNNEEGMADYSQPFLTGPNDVGFDYSFIIPVSLDMIPYAYYKNHKPIKEVTDKHPFRKFPRYIREGPMAKDFYHEKVLDNFTEKALDYIQEQSKYPPPFFLYFALTAPHKPVWPAERFQGSTTKGPYADFIVQIDWTVGQILQALERNQIDKNTLVIFTSDNGSFMLRVSADQEYPFEKAESRESFYSRHVGKSQKDHAADSEVHGYHQHIHDANYIWRGTKGDIWEGGHRVPFIVRWPGIIEGGTMSKQTISITDIMATLADIMGYSLNEDEGKDSFSFLPLLLGDVSKITRAPVIHHSSRGMFAIREGKWKMIFGNGSGGRQIPEGQPWEKPYHLFNLEIDPSETTNVIDQYPEVAKYLSERLDKIRMGKSSK
ncbi:MAG: arylsulfatase [Cyclobacteriaceae bacterium]